MKTPKELFYNLKTKWYSEEDIQQFITSVKEEETEAKALKYDKWVVVMNSIGAMKRYGGSFVKALAECWCESDLRNKTKLEKAFKMIFEEYADLAIRETKKQQTFTGIKHS